MDKLHESNIIHSTQVIYVFTYHANCSHAPVMSRHNIGTCSNCHRTKQQMHIGSVAFLKLDLISALICSCHVVPIGVGRIITAEYDVIKALQNVVLRDC